MDNEFTKRGGLDTGLDFVEFIFFGKSAESMT